MQKQGQAFGIQAARGESHNFGTPWESKHTKAHLHAALQQHTLSKENAQTHQERHVPPPSTTASTGSLLAATTSVRARRPPL